MTEGLVSIITTLYESGGFIAKTIESVRAQTYTKWELVITDDCSTDDGPAIVESFAAIDPRIHFLRLDINGGPGVARNNSIRNSEGQFIAFLDSDDTWMPDKLEKQLELMKRTGCGVVYSSYLTCDVDGRINGMVKCKSKVRYWRIVCDNTIGFLTMMYDRKVTGDAYMPVIRKRQDWGLNIELLRRCRLAYGIKEPLAVYRLRKGSVSREKISLIRYNISIYREVLGYSRLGSVLMFSFVFLPFYFGKKLLNAIKTFVVTK